MEEAIVKAEVVGSLAIEREPETVLAEAQKAAAALKRVLDGKRNKFMFRGMQYLQFEDWQTLGRFYGVTAKEDGDPEPVSTDSAQGFKASAVALRGDHVISRATAYCLNDEPNWKSKPTFQLASMAQTRACSKVLRNVLSWVVVLAGYQPTPAEEMDGQEEPGTKNEGGGRTDQQGTRLRAGANSPIEDLLVGFQEVGVNSGMVAIRLKKNPADATPNEIAILKGTLADIKAGKSAWSGKANGTPPGSTESDRPINQKEITVFWASVKSWGWDEKTSHAELMEKFGIRSVKEIPRSKLDELMKFFQEHRSDQTVGGLPPTEQEIPWEE